MYSADRGGIALEDKKRTIFVVVIALVIVVALLYSFGLSLLYRTPQFELASPNGTESMEPGALPSGEGGGFLVEITPTTVQSVVSLLSRYESYSRTLSISYTWGDDESGDVMANVWEKNGWKRTETILSSGLVENSILGNGRLWLWYSDGTEEVEGQVFDGAAETLSADVMQRIPTYEDVLQLDPSHITAADYVVYDGQPCIFVEAEQLELGYLYRYWISETSGLLMAAETEKSGVLVYKMHSNEVISPFAGGDNVFTLPDGTVLCSTD